MGEYKKNHEDGQYTVGVDNSFTDFKEMGKRGIRRIDGYEKASGTALYTRDFVLPGALFAKVMGSPHARAKILNMDTSRAEALPGVRAVIRYDDEAVEGRELNGSYFGPDWVCPDLTGWALKPIRPVLGDEAFFEGQPVGVAICADSEDLASEALQMVDIDWEVLPFVLDEQDALKPNAPVLRPGEKDNILEDPRSFFEKGDVEKGLKEAEHIVDFRLRRRAHLWAGAEMPSVLVRWRDDKVEIWAHCQQPYHHKQITSEWLGVPMNKVTVNALYQGCSFGGRGNPANYSENGITVLAAIFSKRLGQPVKLVYNRAETFFGASGDIMTGEVTVGFKNDGTITAAKINNLFGVYMTTPGAEHLRDNTRIPNLLCKTQTVDLSKPPAWWCRCEQLPNVLLLTMIFDHVAVELGMDPTEVARINDGCDGHGVDFLLEYKRKYGFPERDSLAECIEAGKKAIGWDEKWHPPGARKLPNGRMHGLGFTWDHQWDDVRGTGSAAILIENDGSISIIGQHCDLGVNPWTTYCQIAADELGVTTGEINVKSYSTDQGFAMMSPDGSANLVSNGYVVRKAARKAKAQLLELAAQKFEEDLGPEELDVRPGEVFIKSDPEKSMTIQEVVSLSMPMHNSCAFWTEAPIVAWAWHTQGLWGEAESTGRPRLCRQGHFMEVEVDPETGLVEVTKIVNVNDVGKVISPESVEGQMYGGSYMGAGRALTEEMIWDPQTGVMLNRNLLDYKYATMLDLGPVETIALETGMGHGPYNSVGIGEDTATIIPGLLAPAVYNAIGAWVEDFPITPDKVLKALGKI